MASPCLSIIKLIALFSLINACFASRILSTIPAAGDPQNQQLLSYHNGPLLRGKIAVNLIWYGKFTPSQRAIVADFITSLSSAPSRSQLHSSVAAWWKTVEKYYHLAGDRNPNSLSLHLGKQILDEGYSAGKSLSEKQIVQLASKGDQENAINVVLTAKDVSVAGFCVNRCGTHGFKGAVNVKEKKTKFAYIWVGNSEALCPGYARGLSISPFTAHRAHHCGLLAGTATNPFGSGFYQGPSEAPLEAATACPGVYAKGAYPGYAGDLLVDPTTGASYNALGPNGRKYLLPAIYDPSTSKCATLV
ncbi:Protein PHOSPHATE-INDUCED 1 [Castilleja foliolosa]|uniref:Protein PHOSPHATE-INDUCED 1 n=1 Tax=Castilleja foliolosa TaxID=1961234 RepID=A0ABD3BR46_9LAMI